MITSSEKVYYISDQITQGNQLIQIISYQYVKQLEEQGETDHEVVFIDGTKLENCAGRYTFCWRGSIEKYLEKVREKVLQLTGIKKLCLLREYLEQQREKGRLKTHLSKIQVA